MVLNKKYVSQTSAIASFDFQDIADGTGSQNFYGGQAQLSGNAVVAFLTTDATTFSNRITEKILVTASTGFLKRSEVNFEVLFNQVQRIKGQARLTVTQGAATSGSVSSKVAVVATLFHVDNAGTPIQMATGQTFWTLDDADAINSEVKTMPFDLTSQIWTFKSGEIMRLKMELYASAGADTVYAGYGCDPADRDDIADLSGGVILDTADTSQLKLALPFILDL